MDTQSLVCIFEAHSDVELLLCRTMLQEAGIDVMVQRAGDPVVSGDIYRLTDPIYFLGVRTEDEAAARQLVEAFQQETEKETPEIDEAADETLGKELLAKSTRMGRQIVMMLLFAVLLVVVISLASQLLR